jgi:hypothetical protein
MPPLPLTTLLQNALPGLSRVSRAVVSTLACRNGAAASANELAASVGLRDRHQLARRLRRDGLPSLERLTGWTRVLHWILEATASDTSLLQLARHDQLDPTVAYRLVRRVTGQRWSEARRAGLSVALLRLRNQCAVPTIRAGLRPQEPGQPPTVASRHEVEHSVPPAGTQHVAPGHPNGVLAARLAVSGNPFDVAIARNGIACVTRGRAAAVDCLELSPLGIAGSVRTGAAPTRVVVSPSRDEAYVTNQFTEDVAIIDVLERRLSGAVTVPGHPLGRRCRPTPGRCTSRPISIGCVLSPSPPDAWWRRCRSRWCAAASAYIHRVGGCTSPRGRPVASSKSTLALCALRADWRWAAHRRTSR